MTTTWLADHLDEPDLVVLDCTVQTEECAAGFKNRSGLSEYTHGHIPGAGFADLTRDLSDVGHAIEFSPPDPGTFCFAMGRLGVGNISRVVLYDAQFGAWAARVWWMLRWVGFDKAAILDGGLQAWKAEGRPLSTGLESHPQRKLTPRVRPNLLADRDEVHAAISDPHVQLVDTLPPESYRGETAPYTRPGHIPSARNIPGLELIDDTGHFRSEQDLRRMHEHLPHGRFITYCGGGILASLNAFVMTRLGYKDVAVYTASLQEWSANPANPMTAEPEPA